MKKMKVAIAVLIIFIFAMCGCDKNKNEDIYISEYKLYLNNTEHYDISTYNGFKCVKQDVNKNDDGTYTVTFEFSKVGA